MASKAARDRQKPAKLKDFLTETGQGKKKDGAGDSRNSTAHARTQAMGKTTAMKQKVNHINDCEYNLQNDLSHSLSQRSPSTMVASDDDRSPVKQRPTLSDSASNTSDSIHSIHKEAHLDSSPLTATTTDPYPNNAHPVSVNEMKEMLLSLKN